MLLMQFFNDLLTCNLPSGLEGLARMSFGELQLCFAPCLQIETIRSNVIGCLTLADVCLTEGLHMTYFGTGG